MEDHINGDEYCYDQSYDYGYDYDHDGGGSDDDLEDSIGGFLPSNSELMWADTRSPSIKVISEESLLAAQREDLHRVMDLLALKEHHARALLIHYCWNVDKVLEVLVEYGKDILCAKAGVALVEHDDLSISKLSSPITCNICFEEMSAEEFTVMDCGHYFCSACWTEHFIFKIKEGQSRHIRCMAHKCKAICDEVKIRQLVGARDPDLVEKFDNFLSKSYIEDNRRVKWCPSVPHCGNAIQIEEDEHCEVECACGLQFCFSCSLEPHSPCSCLMWEIWTKKLHDESETLNWLTGHTKACPKCRVPVQKNGGCNLVLCRCGQTFCWLCGAATGKDHTWTAISGHSCGRYKEEYEKKSEVATRNLRRYQHYYKHYKAHTDSLKLEFKLKEKIQKAIDLLMERELTSKDFSWITNGLDRLFRFRRVLSCSYSFAYFMFGDLFGEDMTKKEIQIKMNLFEDHQQQFETHIEKLSMALEEKFDGYSEGDMNKFRMRVVTLSVATDNLCRNLFEFIETDLLGSLKGADHRIAPYNSKGVEKASAIQNSEDG